MWWYLGLFVSTQVSYVLVEERDTKEGILVTDGEQIEEKRCNLWSTLKKESLLLWLD